MAGTLTFPIDAAFKAMVRQAVSLNKPLHLVKDQGVYLMSFGKTAEANCIVYAKGLDPNKAEFDDWYDKAHRICGGDDFGEEVSTAFIANVMNRGAKTLTIKLTADSLKMEACV